MKLVFWASLTFIAYTYVGYPLWLYLRRRWRSRPIRAAEILPSVSIVMAVHNEEKMLPGKLQNLTELDYPPDRYEIIVVSDGSCDGTNQILSNQANPCLRAIVKPQHQGKASALSRGIQAARGEIVVFTDARQLIEPDAVRRLVANFADPVVGCVSADITLCNPSGAKAVKGVGLYWRIETNIRRWEGATGSLIGAAGCLYAVRKELVAPLPSGTLLDDVYLPLHVSRQGRMVVFEPRARGWDYIPVDWRREFRRKVRTLTGIYQMVRLAPWSLTRANPVRFEFVSHKLLRLLVPFALALLLVSSAFLKGTVYQSLVILQVIFYILGALAVFRTKLGFVSRLADVSFAFLVLNAAAVVALVYFLAGKNKVWVR